MPGILTIANLVKRLKNHRAGQYKLASGPVGERAPGRWGALRGLPTQAPHGAQAAATRDCEAGRGSHPVEGSEAVTGPLEGGTLRPVAEGPRVSLHGVPCGRARLHRGGRDPPGPLVPCGLGGTWRVPVTCSKRPPKAAGPEGKARARMGVCSHSPGQVSLTPSPAGRPGSGRAGSGLGDGRPRGHGGCRVGTSSSPTGPSPVPRLLPFHALFPVLLASKLGAGRARPSSKTCCCPRRAPWQDGASRHVPPRRRPAWGPPRHSPTRTLPFVRSPSLSLLFRAQRWDT